MHLPESTFLLSSFPPFYSAMLYSIEHHPTKFDPAVEWRFLINICSENSSSHRFCLLSLSLFLLLRLAGIQMGIEREKRGRKKKKMGQWERSFMVRLRWWQRASITIGDGATSRAVDNIFASLSTPVCVYNTVVLCIVMKWQRRRLPPRFKYARRWTAIKKEATAIFTRALSIMHVTSSSTSIDYALHLALLIERSVFKNFSATCSIFGKRMASWRDYGLLRELFINDRFAPIVHFICRLMIP